MNVLFLSLVGGVGKTTALANAGYQLAMKGKKVALVDLDFDSGHLHYFDLTGINSPSDQDADILDYLSRRAREPVIPIDTTEVVTRSGRYDGGHYDKEGNGKLYVLCMNRKDMKKYAERKQTVRNSSEFIRRADIVGDLSRGLERELGVDIVLFNLAPGYNFATSFAIVALRNRGGLVVNCLNENEPLLYENVMMIKECKEYYQKEGGDTAGFVMHPIITRQAPRRTEFVRSETAVRSIRPLEEMIYNSQYVSPYTLLEGRGVLSIPFVPNLTKGYCVIKDKGCSSDGVILYFREEDQQPYKELAERILLFKDKMGL